MVGTPASIMVFLAWALLPDAAIMSDVGPMKVMLHLSQMRANFASSERKPKPGCMASAPEVIVAEMILPMLR